MIKLEAPWPAVQTISFLPNPQENDSENQVHAMEVKRAMDGTRYTYVKSSSVRRLTYEFALSRGKSLELRAFILSYHSSEIKMTNHKNEIWRVKLINNPFEFSSRQRASEARETIIIQLQFEGQQI